MSVLALSKRAYISNRITGHVQGFKNYESQLTRYPNQAVNAGALESHPNESVETNPGYEIMIKTHLIAG